MQFDAPEFARPLDEVLMSSRLALKNPEKPDEGLAFEKKAAKARRRREQAAMIAVRVCIADDLAAAAAVINCSARDNRMDAGSTKPIAVAAIVTRNPRSVALHESLGFTQVGVFRRAGFTHEGAHDLGYWQHVLDRAATQPTPIRAPMTCMGGVASQGS